MSQFRIRPTSLRGKIFIPPSKSHTLRAILFGMMGKGRTYIRHYLQSPDSIAMIEAVRTFGAKVDVAPEQLTIEGLNGVLKGAENVIDAGNSGQVLRFIGALAPLSPAYTVITGDHSIRHNRPVKPLLDALGQLKAFAASMRQDGYAPIILKGPMQPGTAELPGEDSQPVSGLLIAAAFLKGKSQLIVSNPGEKPWIDLTLHWLKKLNMKVEHQDYAKYTIFGSAAYDGFDIVIPGDFSSAAFPVAAALITNSELTLENIDMEDCQGDKKLIEVLIKMGAKIAIDPKQKTLTVQKNSVLQGMKIDINDFIDAIAILSVIGCFAEGTTEITNASVARKKESDRIHAMATELKKMGADLEEKEDGLIIRKSSLRGTCLESYRDHRIAMSLSVAALAASGESLIQGVECIAKTYPTFARDFQSIGAAIEVIT